MESKYIPAHPRVSDLTSSERRASRRRMRFFHASIATNRRPEIRRGLRCSFTFDLASRPDPDWQPATVRFSLYGARFRPLPRSRLSPHPARGQMALGRSPSRANRRTPARVPRARRLRLRPRAGYPALARTLGCSDHARRDRDSLRAGNAATSLLRAGGSGSTPYRRAWLAAIGGGGDVAGGLRSATASASARQEAA